MARYKVLALSFIGNALVQEGAEVDYDGVPSSNLEPLDKAAEKAAKTAPSATNIEATARLMAAARNENPDAMTQAMVAEATKALEASPLAPPSPAENGLV